MFSLPPSLFLTTQPEDYWTRSRPRRSNGSSGSQPVVRPNPSAGGRGFPRPFFACQFQPRRGNFRRHLGSNSPVSDPTRWAKWVFTQPRPGADTPL